MATYTVSTSQNYTAVNGGAFSDYDRITINQGATLTINTDTNIIETLFCVTLGKLFIENTSTTTPIFIKTGNDTATGNAQLRFEAGGIIEMGGEWIPVGTSSGAVSQALTLPLNASLESIPYLPTVFVFKDGETEPEIYNRVDSFTDCFGDEILGAVFTDYTLGSGFTDFDLATSGSLNMDKCTFGQNFSFNFSSASSVRVSNTGFDRAREDMNLSSQQSPYFKNVGVQMQSLSHQLNLSAANNFYMENVFVYNVETTAQYHGFYPVNASGGTFKKCKVIAPYVPYSTSRACFYITSPNLVFEDCYVATQGVGWNFGAGSGNTTLTDCGYNASGKRNPSAYGAYMIQAANSSNNTLVRVNSYPLLPADGATAPNTYSLSMSTGTSKFTVHDCDFYVGEAGNPARTNNPIFSNGVGHRVNKIRIHGDFSGDTINHSTASANLIAKNITFLNAETNSNDCEWTDGGFHDLVATPDSVDTAPSASGKDVGTLLHYISNDKTSGRMYKPMGSHSIGSTRYSEVSVTGNILFNNAGAMYMDTAGDVVEFEGNVHGGITAITGQGLRGSTTSNFSVSFAMRVPDGVYGAFQDYNITNLQDAFANLTGYDSDEGLQIKWRVTRGASNVTNYLNHIRMDVTLDPNYEAPFEVLPTSATFKGLTTGDVVYVQDHLNNQKLFKTSDGSDMLLTLPNTNDGESWTYVVKRAGYEHQRGVISITPGVDVVINVSLAQKVQPVGGAMYQNTTNANVDIDIDLATPQLSVDIGDTSVTAQNVLDSVEDALVTNDGMKWLAQQNTDVNFANLGGAGSFLFFENNLRIRRATVSDDDAEVGAYVFSTDGSSTDEVNGTVKLFSGTIVNDIMDAQINLAGETTVEFGQAMGILVSMVEAHNGAYRFDTEALANAPTAEMDEAELHSALDSYGNKTDWKADMTYANKVLGWLRSLL